MEVDGRCFSFSRLAIFRFQPFIFRGEGDQQPAELQENSRIKTLVLGRCTVPSDSASTASPMLEGKVDG